MSRDVFSKNNEKRTRTSSGESNNSFVKNVTSRVSGLLPATITKWFSSPSSNANGSAPAADVTDSSTEDEAPESPITMQPPAKRMRFSSGPGYGTEGNCVTNNIETIETTTSVRHETTSYTVQSPPGRTTFRRETNFVSTPLRSPDESTIERTEKDTTMFPLHTVSTIGPSVSNKRKTLFGNQSQELSEASKKAYVKTSNNTTRDPKQPSFKPALLGSPFYAGRTTYGGAASSYINQPNITQRQNTTVKESTINIDNTISHSARRVMELLESYSSPLTEAKRIPQFTRPTRQEMMKRFSESSSSSPYCKPNSYKTQELHLPSVASILRLKQRSRLNDTTNAARQIIASHSSSSPDYLPYPSSSKSDQTETDTSNKLTTKVKSRLTRPNRGDSKSLDTDTMAPLELPKAVLQINPNNLPNFSSPLPTKTKSSTETPPLTVIRFEPKSVKPVETISTPETISSDSIYNFANPVRLSESPYTKSTPPKFTFGSPERSIDSKLGSENKSSTPTIVLDTKKEGSMPTTTAAAANWSCPDCWVSNKSEADKCVCCGYVKAAKAAAKPKCSLCKVADSQPDKDKCVICEKVQVNNIVKPLKAATSKWQCKDCWVDNNETAEKCVCCGASNPKGAKAEPDAVVAKKPEASAAGMCPKCFGLTTFGKCSKCSDLGTKPSNSLDNVLKSQANKWECENCLVRNDSDKTKCLCCDAERSGALKQPEKKQFNFGTINTSFKFGIDPKVQESNLAKAAEKPAEKKDKEEQSETNNNVLAKAPTFSFGIPAKTAEDKTDAPKTVSEAPKPTFTFGLPKQNSLAPTPVPTFGIPNKSAETSKDKVDSKELETKKPEEAKPVIFGASTPINTSTTSQTSVITSFAIGNKDAPSNPLSLPATNSDAPKLNFSAPKPEGGLFAIPSTTPSTKASFTAIATQASTVNMFQKTDAPKMSLFQAPKSDPPTTATVSLFQKSDAPASAPPPAATAPIFSFGGGQTAQPTADKPKFNFSFGSGSKTDVFKPPAFGGPNDTNTSANKFTLGSTTENLAANPLATGNSLTGNGLNASISGNGLSINPLGAGNGLQASTNMFSAVQKESNNMWSPSNSTANPFGANATSSSAPKPFAFGSSTPFSSNPPAFGASNTQASSTPAFGSNIQATSTPAFGSAAQPTPAFGAASQAAPAPTFGAASQSAPAPTFGAASQSAPTPTFGAASQAAPAPTFGAASQSASAPTFGAASQSAPAPTFGAASQSAPAPTFGAASQSAPAPTFGAASQAAPAPTFGSVQSTPAPNIFGMPNQNSQPSLFATPNQNSTMFGSPQQAAGGMQPPAMGMFGRPNVGATPTFGTPNSSIPTFEAASLTPAQAPAFNFVTPQPTGMFGFGQQQQQPQSQGLGGGQTGVYSFGAAAAPAQAGVQFSMGSAPNAAVRRIRKAARRSQQR